MHIYIFIFYGYKLQRKIIQIAISYNVRFKREGKHKSDKKDAYQISFPTDFKKRTA